MKRAIAPSLVHYAVHHSVRRGIRYGTALGLSLLWLVVGPLGSLHALERLSDAQVTEGLRQLPGWATDGERIYCTYQFTNFVEAIAFVNRLVVPAEAAGHHPDLTIRYNQVNISLSTHDAGGITDLDFVVARDVVRQSGPFVDEPRTCQP
ncbi:MAG TPA: 4a-hydroxytetrahydrobiopterin dehydratase [Chroococcidiopsis sp.]